MSYTKAEVLEFIGQIGKVYGDKVEEYEKNQKEMQRQLEAIETAVARGMLPAPGASSSGYGLSSAAAKEHKEKFLAWARRGGNEDALRGLEVQASLSTVSDPDGGFLIPQETDKSLDRVAVDSVAMRRLAKVIKASGDYKKPFSQGGATGGWVGELETREDTETSDLTMFNPPWSELYALPKVTQALLDMSDFDVEGWLLDELQVVETEEEGAAFISGNGVKKPKGFLAYTPIANASWEWGKVGYIAGGHASLLNNTDKLITLQHSLKPVYRKNATWLMNDNTLEVVRTFKNGNGDYIWRQGLAENAPDLLLGKPIEIDDNMPDIGAGAYPIAFGDWNRAYLIGDHKVGRRLLRDPYTLKGYVKFYLTKRVFGGLQNFQAVKLLKIAAS